MSLNVRKTATAVAAFGALALGGSALANAATSSTAQPNAANGSAPAYGEPPGGGGRHVGANGKTEQALSSADAAKVKAAALKKFPGATIERVETDVDHGSPFEAHVRKADGTQLEVLVNESFEVTAVNTMQHP